VGIAKSRSGRPWTGITSSAGSWTGLGSGAGVGAGAGAGRFLPREWGFSIFSAFMRLYSQLWGIPMSAAALTTELDSDR